MNLAYHIQQQTLIIMSMQMQPPTGIVQPCIVYSASEKW